MQVVSRLAACCVLFVAAVGRADDEAPCVGDLGDPSRLVIEGAKTFAADEIRDALFGDFAVVAACAPYRPLADLKTIVSEKLTAGYQCAGFPHVTVDVMVSDGKLRATVCEGGRYVQGNVQISGCQSIDADRLRQSLTEADAKLQKAAIWPGGEPASFNAEYLDWLKAKVVELAGDQGHYRLRANVSVVPDQKNKGAEALLIIKVVDEGQRSTFANFEFSRIERQFDALLPYLGIDPQSPLTLELRQQIVKRLLASGRFSRVYWELGNADQRDEHWLSNLELEEYESAPLLTETPTREEAALLKLAEWVNRFDDSDDELLIRFPAERVSAVAAPRRGYIVERAPPTAPADKEAPPFLNAAVMAESRVGLYSALQRRKIDAAPPPAPVVGQAEVLLVSGGPKWDGRGRLTAGVGLRSTPTNVLRRHVKMNLKLSAAAALSIVRTHQAKATWEGDVVTLEWKGRRMKINSLTGQLVEQVVEASPDGHDNSDNAWLPNITLSHGEFERRLADIERLSADWPNLADAQRPLSCIGQFICQELAVVDADGKQGYAAVDKLLANGLLEPFDGLIRQACLPGEQSFSIPQPYFHFDFNSISDLRSLSGTLAKPLGMRLGNYLLPFQGWIGSLWRNGVCLLTDIRQEAADEIARQPADDGGVICAWLAAEMLQASGFSELAPLCARRGLRRPSVSSFHDDCRELLAGQHFLSASLVHTVKAFRGLDASEIRAIGDLFMQAEILDEKQAFFFEAFATALSGDGDKPAAETLVGALDLFWYAGFSDWLEQRLKSFAAPSAPAEQKLADFQPAAGGYPEPYSPPGPPAPPAFPPPVGPSIWPVPIDRAQPASGGYGSAAPEDEFPVYRPGGAIHAGGTPVITLDDPEKPLKEEIRELKWLSRAVTDRLEKLEERLYAADSAKNSVGGNDLGAEAVPTAPAVSKLQYVKFFGSHKVKGRHLIKQSGLKVGEPWNSRLVEEARTKLQDYYRDKGYDNVKVTILEGDCELDRGAVFLVDESDNQTICRTQFVGITSAPDAQPKVAMLQATPPPFEMPQRDVDREKIDEHFSRLYEYYRKLGFFRARISRELISIKDPSCLTIRFLIDEGPRYKVHSIRFVDTGSFTPAELVKQLRLKDGDFYDGSMYRKDVEAIKDLYQKRGFTSVDVQPQLRFLDNLEELDIIYRIAEHADDGEDEARVKTATTPTRPPESDSKK